MLSLALLAASRGAPRGFVRDLIESRLLAIVLGVSALVAMGVWIAWQVSSLRERPDGDPDRETESGHGG